MTMRKSEIFEQGLARQLKCTLLFCSDTMKFIFQVVFDGIADSFDLRVEGI